MRPVDQTTYGPDDGNCLRACLASILEIPLAAAPPARNWGALSSWLAGRGLSASLYRSADYVPPGYAIAGGRSKRFAGRMHACVAYDGVVVHDPHPSRDGLPSGVEEYVVVHGPRGESMWFNGV